MLKKAPTTDIICSYHDKYNSIIQHNDNEYSRRLEGGHWSACQTQSGHR